MWWLASTQSCMPSRITLGLSKSLSPTEMKMRIGFFGSLGMSVSWKPQAPSGYLGSNGHAWFTKVPDVVSTRWYRSVRNQAMMSAAEPPELLPITARPSGSGEILELVGARSSPAPAKARGTSPRERFAAAQRSQDLASPRHRPEPRAGSARTGRPNRQRPPTAVPDREEPRRVF